MFHVEQRNTHIEALDHFLTKEKFQLIKTSTPGMLKTSPKPPLENINDYYASKNYTSHNSSAKGFFNHFYRFFRALNYRYKSSFLKGAKQGENVLDFGSGEGYFLNNLSSKGYSVFGIEPIKNAIKPNIYPSIFDNNLKNKTFKYITAWHSIEHVYDLKPTIKAIYDLLDENGTLIVALPNHSSYDAKYYKQYWAGFDVPRHLWHFDKKATIETFSKLGFSFVSSHPLLLDTYYVSLLSENYKKSKFKNLRAFIVGAFSNLKAIFVKLTNSDANVGASYRTILCHEPISSS